MRKIALTFTVTTLVLGIFGAFFRWLQLMNAFDAGTGLSEPGAGTSAVLLIYCVLAAAAICLLTVLWLGRYEGAAGAEDALKSADAVPLIVGWALFAIFAAAACILLFAAGTASYPVLQRLFGACGILAAASVPFLFGKKGSAAGSMGRTASVMLTVFYCFWLIFAYKCISPNPVVWSYALEMPAVAASAVALCSVTAFYYGTGKITRSLIALQLGAFFSVAVLFEERSAAMSVLFGVSAALQLLLEFVLISNMREKRDPE